MYNFFKNYSLDYNGEVYLGGDNIILDYVTKSSDNTITSSNEYATIGTITYIDSNGNYGAIAHELGINNLESGEIFITPVESVIKSAKNIVGEKTVNFSFSKSSGSIFNIKKTGVYGEFKSSVSSKEKVMLGMPKEIKKGQALLYTNIDGEKVKAYQIEIKKIYLSRNFQNIYVKIIDEDLLKITGGVIKGMSGSPIVQNGKIIGALSHVDSKNPEYGYGLFITSMFSIYK